MLKCLCSSSQGECKPMRTCKTHCERVTQCDLGYLKTKVTAYYQSSAEKTDAFAAKATSPHAEDETLVSHPKIVPQRVPLEEGVWEGWDT